jgi:hypothetical protein
MSLRSTTGSAAAEEELTRSADEVEHHVVDRLVTDAARPS